MVSRPNKFELLRIRGRGNKHHPSHYACILAASQKSAHLRMSASDLSCSSAIGSSRAHGQAKQTHGRAKSRKPPELRPQKQCTDPEIYPKASLGRLSNQNRKACGQDLLNTMVIPLEAVAADTCRHDLRECVVAFPFFSPQSHFPSVHLHYAGINTPEVPHPLRSISNILHHGIDLSMCG